MEIYFLGVLYTFDKLRNYTIKFVTILFVQIVFCVILMLLSTIYVFVLFNHLVRHFCVLFNAMQPKLNSNMCWEGEKNSIFTCYDIKMHIYMKRFWHGILSSKGTTYGT
jgi:hypothetical protein